MKFLLAVIIMVICCGGDALAKRFEVADGRFELDGEPYVIKAAELHYPRIPREYWEHRIRMSKALGMNTICLYVFWNFHEVEPDVMDFTGNGDLRRFVELCGENDMKVILRPGPYVCAEWEMGGLPWWLLRKKDVGLRQLDSYFMERVERFEAAVAQQVGDLTVENGGPIIMVQVENEYGSYATDKEYVMAIRDIVRKGFPDAALFQCDWSSNFMNNGLDDLLWTMNFGTGANIDAQFSKLRECRPDAPLMCSEFWSGWFDKWGASHETRSADKMIAGIDEMLSKGISFSLYMTHGGTNWGHWAGANSPGFAPDVTSYDYDAPISESGKATPKYHLLRELLLKYSADADTIPVPEEIPVTAIEPFTFTEVAPLYDNLPQALHVTELKTMEEFGQGFGSIMYRTTLPGLDATSMLTVTEPHDYARAYVNGRLIGTLDRRMGETVMDLPPHAAGDTLDIFVEAMGRINFGRAIKDFKGITESVTITTADTVMTPGGWDVMLFPDEQAFYDSMNFVTLNPGTERIPGVYRARFNVERPADTFLDFSTWGKGLVTVNGHPLGRIWETGPQQTLYMPGCWLREGENEIMVFDVTGPKKAISRGLTEPILDRLTTPASSRKKGGEKPDTGTMTMAAESELGAGNGWQEVKFGRRHEARRVTIEAVEPTAAGDDACSIAEINILGADGKPLSRENWKIIYADSEDLKGGNHSAEKMIDQQESTYWRTTPGQGYPHMVTIDFGKTETVSGIQYLPRMEADAPESVRKIRVYL